MTLDQLRYFCAVCHLGGVTRAASAMNISQPSVSTAIKNLEAEFHVALFHRQQKRLILTTAGQHLLKLATPFLHDADALTASMHSFGNTNAVLRLGVPPMIGSLILPQLFKALPSLSPQLKLQVIESDGNGLRQLLDERKIDMALLPHTTTFDKSLFALKIAEFENVCCVQESHPFAKLDHVSLTDLDDQPLVLFKNSFFQTERILADFRTHNCHPNIVLQTEQLSTLQNMIAEGAAIGFLFSFLAEQEKKLVGIPLNPPMKTNVSLVWKCNMVRTEAIESLINYFIVNPI